MDSTGLRDFCIAPHDGKLWIHCGYSGTSLQGYIRNSSTGSSWNRSSTDNIRNGHSMISFKGALWTIAGYQFNSVTYSTDLTNSVTCSTNGTTWHSMPDAPFSHRINSGIAVLDGKMWIIGGKMSASSTTSTNDIWYTEDGQTWTCAVTNAPFGRRNQFGLVTIGGMMYLIGGEIAVGVMTNDIWKSSDGINWEAVAVSNAYPARRTPSVVAFNGSIYVIAGEQSGTGYTNDIWFTK